MRRSIPRWAFAALPAMMLALPVVGCETIVYRDRPLFEEPPTAAANFVGYSNPQTKADGVRQLPHVGAAPVAGNGALRRLGDAAGPGR
jgi:hypothetical protein